MQNLNIIENQSQVFNHLKLSSDLAYIWAIDNNSVNNMQMVLRANGEDFSFEAAELQLEVGSELSS